MSPEKPTPQHDDEARESYNECPDAVIEAVVRRYSRGKPTPSHLIAMSVMHDLKAAGFEITKRTDLGVTKGLPGLAQSLEALPNNSALNERALRFAGQNAGIAFAGMLETLAPLSEDQRLTAALDLIGRRTDIVAVQLPEPDNGVWYINEHGGNVHPGPVGQLLVDNGAILWGINTDEARTLAAALLAAANVADAAEDGGK